MCLHVAVLLLTALASAASPLGFVSRFSRLPVERPNELARPHGNGFDAARKIEPLLRASTAQSAMAQRVLFGVGASHAHRKSHSQLHWALQSAETVLKDQIQSKAVSNPVRAGKAVVSPMKMMQGSQQAPGKVFSSALEWVQHNFPRTDPVDLLEDLRTSGDRLGIPRKARMQQVGEIWDNLILKDYDRKPLVYISGVSGSGKTALAKFFAEKQEVDLQALSAEHRKFALDTQMVAISFNGATPVNLLDRKWRDELKIHLSVAARLLFRQSSSDDFRTFCEQLDEALRMGQLNFASLAMKAVLKSIVDVNKPGILIVDEPGKLAGRGGGEAAVEDMRHELCGLMDSMPVNFFVLFTTLHSGIMQKEYTQSQRPIFPITLPALSLEDSTSIFLEKLTKDYMHVDNTGEIVDKTTVAEYLAAVSGGHPRSIEHLLRAANYVMNLTTLPDVVREASRTLASMYPAFNQQYPPELLYHVFLAKTTTKTVQPFLHDKSNPLRRCTFDDLVSRGFLLNSVNAAEAFQPMLNMLALRSIATKPKNYRDEIMINDVIKVILEVDLFRPKKLEDIHLYWEKLRRYSASKLNEFSQISIRNYYGDPHPNRTRGALINELAEFNVPIDPAFILRPQGKLVTPPKLDQEHLLEMAFVPDAKNYEGVDSFLFARLISGKVIALVFQHKFSAPEANTTLSADVVKKSYDAGKKKMAEAGWEPSEYVHIFVTWGRKIAENPFEQLDRNHSDANVMILDQECLKQPFGPIHDFLDHIAFVNGLWATNAGRRRQNSVGTAQQQLARECAKRLKDEAGQKSKQKSKRSGRRNG